MPACRQPPDPVRIILDVDTGVDDALAIALAVRHPRARLEAVITVAGNVGVDLTTRNTLRVLDWLGATDIPVAVGADRPLSGIPRDATYWHGPDGLGGARLPASSRQPLADGVRYLIERILAEPGQLTLVCTAPLTNLALAVQQEPAIVAAVREVVLMGGAARPPGNITALAEFNIYADPQAAAVVFGQAWRLTMVGLDVTRLVTLTGADRQAVLALTPGDQPAADPRATAPAASDQPAEAAALPQAPSDPRLGTPTATDPASAAAGGIALTPTDPAAAAPGPRSLTSPAPSAVNPNLGALTAPGPGPRGAPHPAAEASLLVEVSRFLFDERHLAAMALHDPLAVGVALDPSLVTTIERDVQIETRGEHTLGQTVVDLRERAPATGRHRVCVEVDAARFRSMFLTALHLPSAADAPPRPG